MTIVLDTNVLLVAVARSSSLFPIFVALLRGDFTLAVTNDILLEYEEILSRKLGQNAANKILTLLLSLENVVRVDTWFFWELIQQDIDDNKFVDCAIACNATHVVTDDKHFRILEEIVFPSVSVISSQDFLS